jgi:hypothetical protein
MSFFTILTVFFYNFDQYFHKNVIKIKNVIFLDITVKKSMKKHHITVTADRVSPVEQAKAVGTGWAKLYFDLIGGGKHRRKRAEGDNQN